MITKVPIYVYESSKAGRVMMGDTSWLSPPYLSPLRGVYPRHPLLAGQTCS